MDWSQHSIPAMRLEARFGDRLVSAFCERPGDIWAMIADAAKRNPDGEALVCGDAADELARGRRSNRRGSRPDLRGWDWRAATASRCCSATGSNSR